MRLNGKVALVSGGASGMGQSEALIFAREGAKVVVGDVLETEGRQVADKIKAAGGQAQFVKLDVTSEAEWEKAVKATVDAFGKLDVLVNNAGISGTFDPDTLSTSAWDRLMEVNAKGVFLGMSTRSPRCSAPAAAPSSTSRPSRASWARQASTWATTLPRAPCGP